MTQRKNNKAGDRTKFPQQPWAKRQGNKAIKITKKELLLEQRKKDAEDRKAENLFTITGGGGVFKSKMNVKRKYYKRWSDK